MYRQIRDFTLFFSNMNRHFSTFFNYKSNILKCFIQIKQDFYNQVLIECQVSRKDKVFSNKSRKQMKLAKKKLIQLKKSANIFIIRRLEMCHYISTLD